MKCAIGFTQLLRRPAAVAGSVPIKLPVLASAIAFGLSLGFLIFSSVLLPASQKEGPQPSAQLQDESALIITVDNARLLVIDKEGRKTGFDPVTGVKLEEIPSSVYFVDRLDDDVTGESDPQSTAFGNISQPADGVYKVVVSGDALAAFSLLVTAFSRDGNRQPRISLDAVVGAEGTASFKVQFASSPGAVSRLFVEFASFTADLEIELGSGPEGEFEVEGSFTLGLSSDGIDPPAEDVTLKVGTLTTTIPAGSFELNNSGEFVEFEFEGVIGGVTLEFEIRINEDNSVEFEVEGEDADLTGTVNPVEVTLTIGDDIGTANVTAEIGDDDDDDNG